MKELNNSTDLSKIEYPPASDLTAVTITPEQHHDNQKHKLLEDLFGDMYKSASVGLNYLAAPFHMVDVVGTKTTDPKLVNEVEQTLIELGYKVIREEKRDSQGIWELVTISWDRPEVKND
jgi:hypothetical protein